MRAAAALLALLLAIPALADQKPDYSRDNLARFFAQREIDLPPRRQRKRAYGKPRSIEEQSSSFRQRDGSPARARACGRGKSRDL